jgi:hypothetical protein
MRTLHQREHDRGHVVFLFDVAAHHRGMIQPPGSDGARAR